MPACSQRVLAQQVHAVGQQRGAHVDRDLLAFVMEGPAVAGRVAGVEAERVLVQVARALRRAVRAQVLGRGAEHAAHRKERPRDELGGGGRKDLQRAVHAGLDRVDHRVAHDQLEVDVGIADLEGTQQRREVAEHEAGQRMDAQRAGRPGPRAAHLVHDVVGPPDQLGAVAQEGLSDVAEPHDPRAAVEQRRADMVFELLHAAGDHRLGHAHLPGGLGEALGLRDANECLYVFEAVHRLIAGRAPRRGSPPRTAACRCRPCPRRRTRCPSSARCRRDRS